tara:strand:+ start:181 stop:477 length:297 start_codon:yes stop_codon:yes gene_type:complete
MITNVNIKMNENMDVKELYLKLQKAYKENDKIRYVLDTRGGSVSMGIMQKFKKVFDKFEDQAKGKLTETVILVDDGVKKMMMKSYIKIFNSDNKIKIL